MVRVPDLRKARIRSEATTNFEERILTDIQLLLRQVPVFLFQYLLNT